MGFATRLETPDESLLQEKGKLQPGNGVYFRHSLTISLSCFLEVAGNF